MPFTVTLKAPSPYLLAMTSRAESMAGSPVPVPRLVIINSPSGISALEMMSAILSRSQASRSRTARPSPDAPISVWCAGVCGISRNTSLSLTDPSRTMVGSPLHGLATGRRRSALGSPSIQSAIPGSMSVSSFVRKVFLRPPELRANVSYRNSGSRVRCNRSA